MPRPLVPILLLAMGVAPAAQADSTLVQISTDPVYTRLEIKADGQVHSLDTCTVMLSHPLSAIKTLHDLRTVTGFVHMSLAEIPLPATARQAMGKAPELIYEIEQLDPQLMPDPKAKPLPKSKHPLPEPARPGELVAGKWFDVLLKGSVHIGNIRYAVPPLRLMLCPTAEGMAVQSRAAIPVHWRDWPGAESAQFTVLLTNL